MELYRQESLLKFVLFNQDLATLADSVVVLLINILLLLLFAALVTLVLATIKSRDKFQKKNEIIASHYESIIDLNFSTYIPSRCLSNNEKNSA